MKMRVIFTVMNTTAQAVLTATEITLILIKDVKG